MAKERIQYTPSQEEENRLKEYAKEIGLPLNDAARSAANRFLNQREEIEVSDKELEN